VKKEEIAAWRNADGVVLTSAADEKTLLSELPSSATSVVPNAVDLESFAPQPTEVDPERLLFFGAMNYHPNIDGVTYFVKEVLPLIVAERPNVVFEVIGQNPPAEILALAGRNVTITGFVPDPRPYLDRASAVVVPLRVGGGTRFKIVEAMAKGRPIVSTTIGAEGLEVEHGRELLLADDPTSFARETLRLLESPELGAGLGGNARQRAEQSYGWGAAVVRLEQFYTELVELRSRSAARSA
jgi:glycosyltransferase involved in cell wall biosynthesis